MFTLEDFNIFKFKKIPVECSVENKIWNKYYSVSNKNPFKIGFQELENTLHLHNEDEKDLSSIIKESFDRQNENSFDNYIDKKIENSLIDYKTDFFSCITKSSESWNANLKKFSKLNLKYFQKEDLTDENLKFGKGGFGEVYKNKYCYSKVAIKFELATRKSTNSKKIFYRELLMTRKVNHKNILKIIGWVKYKGRLGLVMKYYQYGTLAHFLKESEQEVEVRSHNIETYYKKFGSFSFENKIEVALNIAYTLSMMNYRNLCHFDIKPHNIYMDKGYNPIIADFGLAKIRSDNEVIKANGCTVFYCPPEQIVNKNLGADADIWALGCVIYYLFQEKHPFYYLKQMNKKNVKDKHLYLDFVETYLRRPIFSNKFEEENPVICELVRDCMNIEPLKRIKPNRVVKVLLSIMENEI